MERRHFIHALLAGTAGLVAGAELDLERLLWVPKPMITVPAMPDWTSLDRMIMDSEAHRIIKDAVDRLADAIDLEVMQRLAERVDLQYQVSDRWSTLARMGETMTVRLPWRYALRRPPQLT